MKLSIIVPVYNTEQYLQKCLDSILAQTFAEFELIVVSDASPGNCSEVVNSYSDKRIKYVELKENKGSYLAKIYGAKEASGDYITYIDSDDYLLHDNVVHDLIILTDDVDILQYNYKFVYENGKNKPVNPSHTGYTKQLVNTKEIYYELFHGGLINNICGKIIKKSLWIECSQYFSERHLVFLEDYLAMMPLLYHAKKVITTDYVGYGYFQPNNSATKFSTMSKKSMVKTLEDLLYVTSNVVQFFKDKNLYTTYEKDILDKHRLYYKWIYSHASNFIDVTDTSYNELLSKAFNPWYIYAEIQNAISSRKDIDSTCFLSIVIPVYNTEPYLRRCLDSIINQNFSDYEIILVDDVSPGNCQEIAEAYCNSKIHYIKNPVNMGSAWSRLHGLSMINGRYVYFVDSDDWLEDNSLQKMYNHLQDGYDVLYFNGYYATDSEKWINPTKKQLITNKIIKGNNKIFEDSFIGDKGRRPLWYRVFHRRVISEGAKHMPIEWLSVSDDWILNLFSLWYAKSLKSVDEFYYNYYQDNPNAITSQVENKTSTKIVHPLKAASYIKQTNIALNSLEKFLKYYKIKDKYIHSWYEYRVKHFTWYHANPMIQGLQQYFLEEIQTNPENALLELRNMTHHPLNPKLLLASMNVSLPSYNTYINKYVSTKDLMRIVLKRIKKKVPLIGVPLSIIAKLSWNIIKWFKNLRGTK